MGAVPSQLLLIGKPVTVLALNDEESC
jgi:hypothetical protein